jgi:hypothetical protein
VNYQLIVDRIQSLHHPAHKTHLAAMYPKCGRIIGYHCDWPLAGIIGWG